MLERELYIDRVGTFVFDRLSCLRNEYAKNECSLCLDVCDEHALVFRDGKLRLDKGACTQCGGCIGGCPSRALYREGFGVENVLQWLQSHEEAVFTCKSLEICLGALSVDEWIALLLTSKRDIAYGLDGCELCGSTLKERVQSRIDEANAFVVALGLTWKLEVSHEEHKPTSLRGVLKRFSKPVVLPNSLPSPLISFKRALKQTLEESTVLPQSYSFVHPKAILASCDNCQECVQFCPTQALSYTHDQSKILFQVGKCIGCHICEEISKKKALIHAQSPLDVMLFAYDRADVLISHELRVCFTCKCAFSYKGGEMVCERCRSFEEEHSELFTLASEQK